jgi:hypothetical protein
VVGVGDGPAIGLGVYDDDDDVTTELLDNKIPNYFGPA